MARRKLTEEEKLIKKEKEFKEMLEKNLKDEIKKHRNNPFIPKDMTRTFEVGEEVDYGSFDKSVVVEVFDGGKFYMLECTSYPKEHGHSKNKETAVVKRCVPWTDVRKTGINSNTILHEKDKFFLNYMQQTIFSFYSYVYHFGVDMNPVYQRDHVWSQEDKVNLIDSIMKNYDIGKFLFNRRSYGSKDEMYEIVDGKQRLTAIMEFLEDRFTYKGKTFSELHVIDQGHIEDYSINVAVVNELSQEELIKLFIRVNVTGRVMDEKHLEKVKKMLK